MSQMNPQERLDILNELEKLRNPVQGNSQRYFKRYVVRGEGALTPVEPSAIDHRPIQIALRDLGGGGVGFICDKPLDEHDLYRVDFINNGYATATQYIAVRYAKRVDEGVYLVGATFCANQGLLISQGVSALDLDSFIPAANAAMDAAPFMAPEDLADSA